MKLVTIASEFQEMFLEIGENQQENDVLIRKSDPNDIWFHLDNLSGPHFVLHTKDALSNKRHLNKRHLNYIGSLFRQYKNGLPKRYNVIYTEIKNIKLTDTIGMVIPTKVRIIKY